MKKLKKLLYIVPLLGLMATACTDIESIEIDHIGGNNTKDDVESEAYYADLRAYKETAKNYGRPVAFGWFSNWAPTGAMRRGISLLCPIVWISYLCGAVPQDVMKSLRRRRKTRSLCKK